MDFAAATDPTPLVELQVVQGILVGVSAALDEVMRALPPMSCTWQGTARESYARNLEQLFAQATTMVGSIADARAAISSAISVV